MDIIKSLELDILITISQNKKVPSEKFSQLFDDKWKLYSSRFDDLKLEGLFKITVQNPILTSYELTSKGNIRMMELVNVRNEEIEIRAIQLSQIKPVMIVPGWKILAGVINYLKRAQIHSKEIPSPEPEGS
jgi:hypothetical protein